MNEKATDIIEDLSMVAPPGEHGWIVSLLCALAVLVLAGLLAWRHFRKKKLALEIQPSIPAHIKAREALAAIRPLIAEGKFREFIIAVSRVLRVYIEDRFALRAPHLSTEEFLYQAEQSEALSTAYQKLLEDFLVQCDLVKFALGGTDPEQVEALYRTTEQFIEQTALVLPRQPGPGTPP